MKQSTLNIIYYVAVLFIYWYATYDGPPLRILGWYLTHRTARKIALYAGTVGLYAERRYYESLKEIPV